MNLTLHIWRQKSRNTDGHMATYKVTDISPDMSFLEMLDVLNQQLISKDEEAIAYDHDCREGICGMCSLVINGRAHGPQEETTTCQLHMRKFKDGDEVFIEPWRAKAFPVERDLVVDRSSFDRIIESGGFISVNTGNAPDAIVMPVSKVESDIAMDAASCIGCGACVAQCKNSSAMLFVAAKVGHLAHLPQGQAERTDRVRKMVAKMDEEQFGSCTNQYECEAACPKGISVNFISEMNRDFLKAGFTS